MLNAHYQTSILDTYMVNATSAERPRYVFVFWDNRYQDQQTLNFVTSMRNAGIEVKVIAAADSTISHRRATRRQLQHDITLDEAIGLAQNAACVFLPYDKIFLSLILMLPNIEVFIKKAAQNNAHFISHTEIVALFSLDKTTDRSFDLVYPSDENELEMFMAQAGITLKAIMGK